MDRYEVYNFRERGIPQLLVCVDVHRKQAPSLAIVVEEFGSVTGEPTGRQLFLRVLSPWHMHGNVLFETSSLWEAGTADVRGIEGKAQVAGCYQVTALVDLRGEQMLAPYLDLEIFQGRTVRELFGEQPVIPIEMLGNKLLPPPKAASFQVNEDRGEFRGYFSVPSCKTCWGQIYGSSLDAAAESILQHLNGAMTGEVCLTTLSAASALSSHPYASRLLEPQLNQLKESIAERRPDLKVDYRLS